MNTTDQAFTFRPPQRRKWLRLALGFFLSLLALGGATVGLALMWLPHSLSYEVKGSSLVVETGFTIRPNRREVSPKEIESATAVQLKPGRRVGGTGMPGYCTGHFKFPDLGSVRLASDCGPHAVVLHIRGWDRPWVLSPKDREAFLAALSGEGLYSETLTPGTGGIGWKALKIVTAVVLIPILFIPVIFFISPNRLRYRVGPGHVEIDLTLGTKRFSVGNCIARVYEPESSSKIIGSSLPGYHSGRFSIDGMRTRVYSTDLGNGVLIEGPDLRLFLNPEDPHVFLEALRVLGSIEVE